MPEWVEPPLQISEWVRENLVIKYPGAFAEPSHARLFQELLFPMQRDEWNGDPVMSQARLAQLEGRVANYKNHRYSGKQYLEGFEEQAGIKLRIQDANWLVGRARTVGYDLPQTFERMMKDEWLRLEHTTMVDFVTGREIPPEHNLQAQAARRKAQRQYQPEPGPNQEPIIFLNQMRPQSFEKFDFYLQNTAVDIADSIRSTGRRASNMRLLLVLSQRGIQPFYQDVLRSPRIYTTGPSMSQLSSNVRDELMTTALHFDLVAAQLAIIAKLWRLPTIEALLHDHLTIGSIWPTVLQLVGLDEGDKDGFKRVVYATAYGMTRPGLYGMARRWLDLDGPQVQRLMNTPFMRELLRGRDGRLAQLRREGGIVDAFKTGVRMTDRLPDSRDRHHAENSLLAHEAQSYERMLMQPVLDLAIKNREFRIVLWLHDGVYASVSHRGREGRYLRQLVAEVDARAQKLGFATRLEAKKLERNVKRAEAPELEVEKGEEALRAPDLLVPQ